MVNRESEMNKTAMLEWARSEMENACDAPMERGYRYRHGIRVASLALQLADVVAPGIDRDVLEVAAVLHDIGKSDGRGNEGHGNRGAAMVREYAAQWFSGDEIERVCRLIELHYARAGSRWYRGKSRPAWEKDVMLLQDADLLDHFGCNSVWLYFCRARNKKQDPKACIEEYWQPSHDPEWREEARRSLNFDVSRRELELRLQRSDCFFRRFAEEQDGRLAVAGVQTVPAEQAPASFP